MTTSVADAAAAEDPYLWLEEVEGDKALEWVRAQNAHSLGEIEGDRRFEPIFEDAKAIYTASDRIPYGFHENGRIHNFWQDAAHVRGLLRCTTLDSYCSAEPAWDIVLDVDALAKEEGEDWVYSGRSWHEPSFERCMVLLSRGGSDAVVMREFDVAGKCFVEDGFTLPEAKQSASWLDRDRLLVATPHGGGGVNTSGYPRQVRIWQRGTPIDEAVLVYEAREDDAMLFGAVEDREEGSYALIVRYRDFHHQQLLAIDGAGMPRALDLPDDVEYSGIFKGHLLLSLRSDWQAAGEVFKAGCVVAVDWEEVTGGSAPTRISIVAEPPANGSIEAVSSTRDEVLVGMLDNVTGKLIAAAPGQDGWTHRQIDLPPGGSLHVTMADDHTALAMVNHEDFLNPRTLYLLDGAAAPRAIKALPARFDASPYVVDQHIVASADGTQVPYFLMRRRDTAMDGATPTLLYGYGGFEIALSPSYVGPASKAWLENGGAWVVANIRGGGEFGPAWHQAALKHNRQRAYEDFFAVAEDLTASGLTSPRRLGIYGGSNGGLLVGVALTQRPELFHAVVCAVPLLDMMRYHTLLAGASWIGEYGDPEVAEDRDVIARYSPYQNVRPGKNYPKVYFWTSTRDDRVHPGHARKMAARMMEQGHKVLYYENIEGGHSAAADLLQMARRDAQTAVFLLRTLSD
jgi:prolyl oligopeptidase